MLEFRVFNISQGTQLLIGRLPLTPGSRLTWFGFSEEGQLSCYDSKVLIFEPQLYFFLTINSSKKHASEYQSNMHLGCPEGLHESIRR